MINRREMLAASAGAAALLAGSPLARRSAFAAERPALPIPRELRPGPNGEVRLNASPSSVEFLSGVKTPTFGINGPYLGPAIRARSGETLQMRVHNGLAQDLTMHWHGLKIPGDVDGSPYNIIRPGANWDIALPIDQHAATCWFHPHVYPATAELVIKGLAGLFLIDDEQSDALPLPSTWGVDDIPVIIQDRHFNSDGAFFHRFNLAAVTTGYVEDVALINGAVYPQAKTARGWIRLRLLNGSNARSYRLAISDDRPFFVIASDGGLLEEPVRLSELTMYAGERYEVLVDARNGNPFELVTRPVSQLAMNLPPFDTDLPLVTFVPDGADGRGRLPDALVPLEPLDVNLPPVSRNFVMNMNLDDQGMKLFREAGLMAMNKSGKSDAETLRKVRALLYDGPPLSLSQQLSANAVNGKSFALNEVSDNAPIGVNLRWRLSEGDDRMLHPVHIHGCQFRLLSISGKQPPAHMRGWKDIAPVEKGGFCDIQVAFRHPASRQYPFMLHCHILEHEDSGMMTDFTVS
nr:multicopper oxidase CueO [Flavimaribacter sediminis]